METFKNVNTNLKKKLKILISGRLMINGDKVKNMVQLRIMLNCYHHYVLL